jgi:hypothetical protein
MQRRRMSIRVYAQWAAAVLIANLVVGLVDGNGLSARLVAKSVLAGLLAAAFLAAFHHLKARRKGRPS